MIPSPIIRRRMHFWAGGRPLTGLRQAAIFRPYCSNLAAGSRSDQVEEAGRRPGCASDGAPAVTSQPQSGRQSESSQ
jgi:hypothetical protein